MGYGTIHVWIMTERCQPAIGAKWIIDVFDCKGRRPLGYISFDEGKTWEKDARGKMKLPCFNILTTDPENPHATVKVPPGTYKVDARQSGCQNPVHETMAILPSLAEVTVYLIAGSDGWLRRILPVIDVRARMRPIEASREPVEKPPKPALMEDEVKVLSDMLRKIQTTIPREERVPIDPEAVGCWIETVDTAEAKKPLDKHRKFLVE